MIRAPKVLTERSHRPAVVALMHPAARLQFERAAREFARWRAVPERDRSPAPAWWWQPAFEVREQQEEMTAVWCQRLELPHSSTYAAGAPVLMAALADQTSLPWADEFPRKTKRDDDEELRKHAP